MMPAAKPESLTGMLATFPEAARERISEYISRYHFRLQLTSPRKQRLGSFRAFRKGEPPLIRINNDLDPALYLLVFLHELAHLEVWLHYGRRVRPHGKEWKQAYRSLAAPFLNSEVFPEEMITNLVSFFRSPGATFYGSSGLQKLIIHPESTHPTLTLHDIPDNERFFLPDGREMIKLHLVRSRFKCYNPVNRRYYLVPAAVQIIRAGGKL